MPPKSKPNLTRRALVGLLAAGLPLSTGCFSPWFASSREPVSEQQKRRAEIKETLSSEKRPRILSEIGIERALTRSTLENVGLVTRLVGTGGIVKASQPRERLLDTMRKNNASQPNTFLDDPGTTMVVASVEVPPAARKGEVLDVKIVNSSHSEVTSLERGWLFETPLVEMSRLGGQVREGFKMASAEGQIVTVAQVTGSQDPQDQLRGSIVGGAQLLKQRELGIGIDREFADAVTMAAILPQIRARFTVFDGRKHTGIATPVDDSYIKLAVPRRYELDPYHFVNVVLQIGFNETADDRAQRLHTLSLQLLEPTTVRRAAWQLEAIGEDAIPILAQALDNPDREIRFYAAHALAYMDDRRAIPVLAQLSRQEPAFRAMCLNALAIVGHYEAEDALRELLHTADPECRYGAVRGLRYRNERDPQITGTLVGDAGRILEIPSSGPPLIAVSLSQIPEIVIFGENPQLSLPQFEYVTQRMMIRSEGNGTVTLSHFEPGQEDRTAQATSDLRGLLQGIAEVGGTYGDWVSFIRVANAKSYLTEPIAMNPIPHSGRTYQRLPESRLEPGERLFDETIINSLPLEEQQAKDAASKKRSWFNPFSR